MSTYDLGTIEARLGDDLILPFCAEVDDQGNEYNLSQYGTTVTSQLRPSRTSTEVYDFTVTYLNLDGHLDDSYEAVQLVLKLPDEITRTLRPADYVMDVQFTGGPDGTQTPYEATIRFIQDVTRP